jgi:hypothetical protein
MLINHSTLKPHSIMNYGNFTQPTGTTEDPQNQPPRERKSSCSVFGSLGALAASVLVLASQPRAAAQSDNFDSGALSPAWKVYDANPALVSLTFPTVGTGKGLRIQVSPYAAASLPAVAGIGQANVYTDFYVALDLVNWVVENQAAVVFARFTPGGAFGLDGGQGMILNYDAAQSGDNPGNTHGGEFQINTVTPGFKATTLAACQMTPVLGHSYRLVFQGVGQLYTGQMYDLNDLTTPLATLRVTDPNSTFASGISGFLSYSRNGVVGTTDVTIDNYYAAASDPNLATPPALMHSIPGTPIVETRVPAERWQNFYNPAAGISFVAKTYTADVINASATRLTLNGVDFSSLLTLSTNGTVITGSLPGSALKTNSLYAAQISLADTTGLKTSVNTFWFDTFTEAYLSVGPALSAGPVKTIECEDYNYSNGVYQLDPIQVSGLPTNGNAQVNGEGVGYFDSGDLIWLTMGTEGVDFHTTQSSPKAGWDDYRPNDAVMTGEGIRQEIQDDLHPDNLPPWFSPYSRPDDNTRQKYAAVDLVEYLVIQTHAGDWLNYTRSFTSSSSNYFALLRVGSFDSTTITLSQVTSDPSQTNQTTSVLGTFTVPDQIRRSNFSYVPLLQTNGLGSILNLSGTNTLRLTMGGTPGDGSYNGVVALNYLLLVPAQVTVQSSPAVTGPYADDPTATVNVGARTITIPTPGASRFYRLAAVVPVNIAGISLVPGALTLKY